MTTQLFTQTGSVYGVFAGSIDTEAAQRIIRCLAKFTDPRTGVGCIHILMHSPGGQIPEGVTLHNFFKVFPLKLILYNSGNVDSAAVLAFLGAKERRASTYATFAIHRSHVTMEHPHTASNVQHVADMMLIEDERTEAIYRGSGLALTAAHWQEFKNNETVTFSAKEALVLGFVQEISEFSPPPGTTLFAL
jgi:ATP-dependent protease ClpP protease subunit